MPDAVAHGRTVLSAVLGGDGSVRSLDYAAGRLADVDAYITDPYHPLLFKLLVAYAAQTGGIMTREALGDLLRARRPGSLQQYDELYAALAAEQVASHSLVHSVHQLRDLAADRATGNALAAGMKILRDGARDEDTGRELHGHKDAREYVLGAFAGADRAAGATDSPEGDVTAEGGDVLTAYSKAKALRRAGKFPGVQFGLRELDSRLDGLGNGEMAVLVAGTSAGKSSMCVQVAWFNAVMCGKNVQVFTTEQLRHAWRVKIAARHSRLPNFGLPRGLNSAAIRGGRLTDEEERVLALVLDDLKTREYGQIQVVQMPEQCTIPVMAARSASLARTAAPDLVIADYLQLFSPGRVSREAREHESQAGILKQAQRWAATFLDGRGVPFITPWQSSREGRRSMRANGSFTLEDLSATDEAGRTPDVVLGLANPEEDTSRGRAAPLQMKVLKNRNGAHGDVYPLIADFATCHFADQEDQAGDLAQDFQLDL